MPSPTDFKKAFGIVKGGEIDGCRVEDAHVGHDVKQENERYMFPSRITLSLGEGVSETKALAAFKAHVRDSRIVYSAYGSPYECSYGLVKRMKSVEEKGEGTVSISCVGEAVRRRDIPTLKEVKEKEREEQGQAQEVSPEDEKLLSGMRVIKSRFATSKCSRCGQTIDPGVRIARPQGEHGLGGWAHVGCVVAEERKKQGSGGPGTPRNTQAKKEAAAGKAATAAGKAAAAAGKAKGAANTAGKKRGVKQVAAQRGHAARGKRTRR